MLLELSEEIIDIIDESLTDYCNLIYYPLNTSRALGALRNAVKKAKDFEELKKKHIGK